MLLWIVAVLLVTDSARRLARYGFVQPAIAGLAGWLAAAGVIVVTAEALSLARLLDRPAAWLGCHLVLWLAVRRFVPPRTDSPASGLPAEPDIDAAADEPLAGTSSRWLLWTVGLACPVLAVLSVASPPNTWDSMTYHLSRVGYYLQHASLSHFETNNSRQVDFPFNAELLIMWPIVFLRSDVLAALVQFFAGLLTSATIYQLGLECGAGRRWSLVAACLFLTFPVVIFEATSTHNDLVVAWFVASTMLFTVRFARTGERAEAVVAGLALGMGLGTKGTFLLLAPGCCAAAALALWKARSSRESFHTNIRLLIRCGILGFVSCGSLWIVQNWRETGKPLGRPGEYNRVEHPNVSSFAANVVRHGWQLVDWSGTGLESVASLQQSFGKWLFADVNVWLNDRNSTFLRSTFDPPSTFHMQEETAWFGPNGWWCAVPMFLIGLFAAGRRHCIPALVLALVVVSYLLLQNVLVNWQPWGGRLHVPAMALALPVVACGLRHCAGSAAGWRQTLFVRWQQVMLACAVLTTVLCTAGNSHRKVSRMFTLSREELRCHTRPEMLPILDWLNRRNASPATVGFFGSGDDWDYLCFLPNFGNTVHRHSTSPGRLAAELQSGHLDYAIVHRRSAEIAASAEYVLEPLAEKWTAIRRRTAADHSPGSGRLPVARQLPAGSTPPRRPAVAGSTSLPRR